jgi:hypothetical protein
MIRPVIECYIDYYDNSERTESDEQSFIYSMASLLRRDQRYCGIFEFHYIKRLLTVLGYWDRIQEEMDELDSSSESEEEWEELVVEKTEE